MAYIFYRGKFIKGKVQENLECDDYDGDTAKISYSRFVDEQGTAIISNEGTKFHYPVGRTKRSLWKKTLEENNHKIALATSKLSTLMEKCNEENEVITEAFIKEGM